MAWLGPVLLAAHDIEQVPFGVPGVYLLQHRSETAWAFRAFYVGQSHDLRRRLAEHGRCAVGGVGFFKRCRPAYFSAAVVSPHLLDDMERSLIHLLRPPANEAAPLPTAFCLPTLPSLF